MQRLQMQRSASHVPRTAAAALIPEMVSAASALTNVIPIWASLMLAPMDAMRRSATFAQFEEEDPDSSHALSMILQRIRTVSSHLCLPLKVHRQAFVAFMAYCGGHNDRCYWWTSLQLLFQHNMLLWLLLAMERVRPSSHSFCKFLRNAGPTIFV